MYCRCTNSQKSVTKWYGHSGALVFSVQIGSSSVFRPPTKDNHKTQDAAQTVISGWHLVLIYNFMRMAVREVLQTHDSVDGI